MTEQKAEDRLREQLMCRTNSLKKAVRHIIEHTDKRKTSHCVLYSCIFEKMMTTIVILTCTCNTCRTICGHKRVFHNKLIRCHSDRVTYGQ